MGLANVANIPEDAESLNEWSFSHQAHHFDINQAILKKYGLSLPIFPTDPMDLSNLGTWFYWHQTMHNNQNAILGIEGNNLLDVNWTDQGQRTVWVQSNFTEHLEANNALAGVI